MLTSLIIIIIVIILLVAIVSRLMPVEWFRPVAVAVEWVRTRG